MVSTVCIAVEYYSDLKAILTFSTTQATALEDVLLLHEISETQEGKLCDPA